MGEERYDPKSHRQHARRMTDAQIAVDGTEADMRQFRAVVEMIVEHGLEGTIVHGAVDVMDILRTCKMLLDGPGGHFTLEF